MHSHKVCHKMHAHKISCIIYICTHSISSYNIVPLCLDLPVHRYRVYWSERLHPHEYTTELVDLRQYHHRVPGTIHAYRLTGLKANRTYLLELQAICLWHSKRLKSDRVSIEIVTPMKAVRGKSM